MAPTKFPAKPASSSQTPTTLSNILTQPFGSIHIITD
jgi:hypothetical protein